MMDASATSTSDQLDPDQQGLAEIQNGTAQQNGVHQQRPSKSTEHQASFLRAARAGNLNQVLEFVRNGIDINTSNSNGLNALHLASKEGHIDVVRELIRRGALVDSATRKGNTALHIASLAGQEIVVTILVENNATVNAQSLNGFTPLYMASQENHEVVVRYLLAHGANPALSTEDGFTPLAVALQQGHDRIVALLLENDNTSKIKLPALHIAAKKDDVRAATLLLQSEQNPNITSKSGFTPLHIAAHYGNEAIAQLLIDKGANVNFQARHNISPLHVAAKWGRPNLCTLLLSRGAIIDCRTRDLLTPLHCAARSGHDQVTNLLLDAGAPIAAKTKNGLAPLHMAAQGNHVGCARILLYNRAEVDDVTVDYLSPLHVAAHCGHVEIAKLLLDRNADPNARALNGFTPLHIACKKNRIKVVELLLKYHAAIEATTESGLTPLHVASFMGCINIVIFLIQRGANVNCETVRGETPLHLAARANQTDIVRVLVRNKASVDAQARELQTPLHIASRLGNTEIAMALLSANANPNAATKDQYTPLHIAAKENQEEVLVLLLDKKANKNVLTRKGFAPIHLAAKYANYAIVKILLDHGTPVDLEGKNMVTPLHVAAHYNNQAVAQLLLERKAQAQASAKNGYTPLHIAAKKNQMEIANSLLAFRADPNSESRAGFTPLHLAAEEGHQEMAALLIQAGSKVDARAKNGLAPMHLCAQEDHTSVASELFKHGADLNAQTNALYTPLHVACHFGQLNMIRFLVENGALVNAETKAGYTPLHQAAQQGHNHVVRYLIEHGASPNSKTITGQTPLSIAQRLGYVSVVETLKTITETTVITETITVTEERYRPQNPEAMNETMFSDSEDEPDDHQAAVQDHARDFSESITQGLHDSAIVHMMSGEGVGNLKGASPFDSADADLEALIRKAQNEPVMTAVPDSSYLLENGHDDNDSNAVPHDFIQPSFLISFLVDARGGAMRGCRNSGVRVIIPPRKAPAPIRITCRYLKKEKLSHPPPLSEGEALASRILEMGPHGAKFLGPVILEVPHFASLRGREREIVILRSDDGQHWKEHQLEATEDAVQEVLNESFNASDLQQLDELHTPRITRILTNDFPMYFAVVTRVRQEVHLVGPEGGVILSSVVPQVQAIFPDGSLTKNIKVSVQAQPVPHEIVKKLYGNRVAVSPIVAVEPRRRKFHKPITLFIPLPQHGLKSMHSTQISTQSPAGDKEEAGQESTTLRLLCSITGGSAPAQWEDITGTTQLTFAGQEISFTTTVSARFWLMDCQMTRDAARMAQEIYNETIAVPYIAKFVVFARRPYPLEGQLRLFCITDDKEDKTLEKQEHFIEIARSREVEVLSNSNNRHGQHLEFAGNIVPVTKRADQLSLFFVPFQENRLAFNVKVRNQDDEQAAATGKIAIMKEPRNRSENLPPQHPICTLSITLPDYNPALLEDAVLETKAEAIPISKKFASALDIDLNNAVFPAELVSRKIGLDWPRLARSLGLPDKDIRQIKRELNGGSAQEPSSLLKIWLWLKGEDASVAELEQALRRIGRDDIVRSMNNQGRPDEAEIWRQTQTPLRLSSQNLQTYSKEALGSVQPSSAIDEQRSIASDESSSTASVRDKIAMFESMKKDDVASDSEFRGIVQPKFYGKEVEENAEDISSRTEDDKIDGNEDSTPQNVNVTKLIQSSNRGQQWRNLKDDEIVGELFSRSIVVEENDGKPSLAEEQYISDQIPLVAIGYEQQKESIEHKSYSPNVDYQDQSKESSPTEMKIGETNDGNETLAAERREPYEVKEFDEDKEGELKQMKNKYEEHRAEPYNLSMEESREETENIDVKCMAELERDATLSSLDTEASSVITVVPRGDNDNDDDEVEVEEVDEAQEYVENENYNLTLDSDEAIKELSERKDEQTMDSTKKNLQIDEQNLTSVAYCSPLIEITAPEDGDKEQWKIAEEYFLPHAGDEPEGDYIIVESEDVPMPTEDETAIHEPPMKHASNQIEREDENFESNHEGIEFQTKEEPRLGKISADTSEGESVESQTKTKEQIDRREIEQDENLLTLEELKAKSLVDNALTSAISHLATMEASTSTQAHDGEIKQEDIIPPVGKESMRISPEVELELEREAGEIIRGAFESINLISQQSPSREVTVNESQLEWRSDSEEGPDEGEDAELVALTREDEMNDDSQSDEERKSKIYDGGIQEKIGRSTKAEFLTPAHSSPFQRPKSPVPPSYVETPPILKQRINWPQNTKDPQILQESEPSASKSILTETLKMESENDGHQPIKTVSASPTETKDDDEGEIMLGDYELQEFPLVLDDEYTSEQENKESGIVLQEKDISPTEEFLKEELSASLNSSLGSSPIKKADIRGQTGSSGDNVSEASLLEFERIEMEVSKRSQGRQSESEEINEKTTHDKLLPVIGSSNSGSMGSLIEFENLEREVQDQVIGDDELMILSDIREESAEETEAEGSYLGKTEDEQMDQREDFGPEDIEQEMEQTCSNPGVSSPKDLMQCSVDSLDAEKREIMETSADSLELKCKTAYRTGSAELMDRDSLTDESIHRDPKTSSETHEAVQRMSGSPEITETTFETVFKDKNGDDERIIRRVTTKVHDPRSSKVKFTGTENEDELKSLMENCGTEMESQDEQGNVTSIKRIK